LRAAQLTSSEAVFPQTILEGIIKEMGLNSFEDYNFSRFISSSTASIEALVISALKIKFDHDAAKNAGANNDVQVSDVQESNKEHQEDDEQSSRSSR
jgi:hypothetical protein